MVRRTTENTVREAPMTGERLRPANYDAAEIRAKALIGFAQDVGQAGERFGEIADRYDRAEAKKADAEDAIELAKIRTKAITAVGTEAPKAAEEARIAAADLKKKRLATLKGRRGSYYSTAFDQRMAAFEEQVGVHEIRQADVAERGAAAARAETSITLAVDGYADPQIFNDNMATAERDFRIANRGMGEDEIKRKWSIEKSKAHTNIAQQIMATNTDDPSAADKWIEDHAADILPEHETQLRKSLQPLIDDEQADADMARAMAFGNGVVEATSPDDGQDSPDLPTPAAPRAEGKPPANVTQHLVNGKGRVSSTATAHRLRGSGNALDIAAPLGTPIRPPMSGKVIKSWLDLDHGGGWSLLVQHDNGTVTGYAHMKGRSPIEVGQEVDSTTVIGSVGSTGKSTGPHLHFTVRKAGVKVDPQTVDWSAVAGGKGPATVDPEKVSWKEGELPRYSADKNVVGSMLDNIHRLATKENWSRQRYERAITKARQFAGVQEQVYAAQYDDLKDRVWGKIAELDGGDSLTSIAQLGAEYGQLEGSDQLTVRNLIQTNLRRAAEGTDIKANGDTYTGYRLMALGSPEERQEFLRQDFRADPNITRAERSRLTIMQQQMRNDVEGKLAADTDRVLTVVNRYAPEAGFEVTKANKPTDKQAADRRKRALLMDRVTSVVDRRQKELQRPLTDPELEGIVRSQTVTIHREGEKMPLYIARTAPKKPGVPDAVNPQEVYESIPTNVRDSIIRSLQLRGVRPTPRLVIETYLEGSK